MLLSVLLLFWMLAACRGHWRGRYVDLKTSANLKSVILVLEGPQCPGLTSVLGGTPAIHKMSVQISSVFQNPGAAQLTLRDLKSNCEKTNKKTTHNLNYLLNKFRFFFSFLFFKLLEKKGERIWDANTCFTAQRPHCYSLAMSLVTCMAWSRQNLGLKKEKEMGEMTLSCLCKNNFGVKPKKKTKKPWHTFQVQHIQNDKQNRNTARF